MSRSSTEITVRLLSPILFRPGDIGSAIIVTHLPVFSGKKYLTS
jgi:hypothetical protein